MNSKPLPHLANFHPITIYVGQLVCALKKLTFLFFLFIAHVKSAAIPESINLSDEEKQWLTQHKVVLVGGGLDWAPFDFIDEDKQYNGIANDYLVLLSAKTGLTFQVVVDQWSNNLQKIKDKKIALLPAVYYTEDRNQFLNFSEPYFSALDYFFIRDDLEVADIQDLYGLRVAIPKDFAHGDFLKKNFPELIIVSVNTFGEAIDAVIENKADVLYDTYAAIAHTLKTEGINSIIPFKSTRSLGYNSLHMVTHKENWVLASILQKGMKAITDEEKQRIYERWLGWVEKPILGMLKLTEKEKHWLAQHNTIRFSGNSNRLPYESIDEQGKHIGIVAKYLKLIGKQLNLNIEIQPTNSWNDSIKKMQGSTIDVISTMLNTAINSEIIYTDAIVSSPIVIVMHDDQKYVENLNEIKNKKIAIIADDNSVKAIVAAYPSIRFLKAATVQEGLADVLTGKIDALLVTLTSASYQISSQGINHVRIVGRTEFKASVFFGIRKELSPLLPLFNRAIGNISQSEKQKILNTWGEVKLGEFNDYRWLVEIVAVLLVLMLLILYWNHQCSKISFGLGLKCLTKLPITAITNFLVIIAF